MIRKTIRHSILVMIAVCADAAYAGPQSGDAKLYGSIGRIIAVEDSRLNDVLTPLEIGVPDNTILNEEYTRNIQKLPVKKRITFFWGVMMHTLLDGESYHNFVELVSKDCRKDFSDTLRKFLDDSKAAGRSDQEVKRAGLVYAGLKKVETEKRPN